MLASVLNSPVAISVSIEVVRAFIRRRGAVLSHKELARKVDAMEKKYDSQFKVVFDAIRKLMEPIERPTSPIGFRSGDD
jgi:DNA-binding response OmpR family regulator